MQDNSPRRNHRGLCTYEGNKMWNYEILGTDIYHLLAAFVLYSILGWALESTYMSFCNHKMCIRDSLRAERMYEEALGDRRKELDRYITVFEAALKKGIKEEIEEAREALNEILEDEDE